MQLWSTFKRDFPNGRINKQQLRDLIKKTFPRGVPDLFVDNIFRIFDPGYNGFIRFTDLLIAFSMSMKGTGKIKMQLYSFESPTAEPRAKNNPLSLCKISA